MARHPLVGTRTWCIFRNLVHTVYRESRHLGPLGDRQARVTVSSGPYLNAAKLCQSNRADLKSNRLHTQTADAVTAADVLCPYEEKTGLWIDEVIAVFRLPNWKPDYGSAKWANIAETLKKLLNALESHDSETAVRIGETVGKLEHNSGSLVPSRAEWQRDHYLQEKWPELCE